MVAPSWSLLPRSLDSCLDFGLRGRGERHDLEQRGHARVRPGEIPNGANAASLLQNNFGTLYTAFVVGDLKGFVMFFGTSATLLTYLPQTGPVGPLNADLIDPTSSSAGAFGGDVSALKLNVDFTDAGLVHGTAAVRFGDLTINSLTTTPDFNGLTVRQALAVLDSVLGGLPTSDTYTDLDALARELDGAFGLGIPSQFAQDHLQAPSSVPEPSSLLLFGAGLAVCLGGVAWRRHHRISII